MTEIAAALIGAVLGLCITVAVLSDWARRNHPQHWEQTTGLHSVTRRPIDHMGAQWTRQHVERSQR